MDRRSLLRGGTLALFAICVVAWIWSYPFRERLSYDVDHRQKWIAELGNGGVFLGRNWGYAERLEGWEYRHLGRDPWASEEYGFANVRLLGFMYYHSSGGDSFLIIPLWFPSSVAACIFVWIWRKTRPDLRARFPVIASEPDSMKSLDEPAQSKRDGCGDMPG